MIGASGPAPVLRQAILGLLGVNEALLILGVVLYPTVLQADGLLGLGAATVILGVYGGLALASPLAPAKADPRLVRGGVILGLTGGAILCLDLVAGYLISHSDQTNATTSLLAYGCFLLLLVGAGGWGAARTGQIRRRGDSGALVRDHRPADLVLRRIRRLLPVRADGERRGLYPPGNASGFRPQWGHRLHRLCHE